MKNLPKYAAWIDLETSGSKLEDSVLLEVGVVFTTLPQLEVLYEVDYTTLPLKPTLEEIMRDVDPVVYKMHGENGLWRYLQEEEIPPPGVVDAMLSDWVLDNYGEQHIALAGSGVSHFDRQFIRRDLPRFDKRLTYWALDVGVLRRTLQCARVSHLIPASGDSDTKNHRALDDARQHLDEYRHYVTLLHSLETEAT